MFLYEFLFIETDAALEVKALEIEIVLEVLNTSSI